MTVSQEEVKTLWERCGTHPHLAARAWYGPMGDAWAERNPTDGPTTDKSWLTRYGLPKTQVMAEALADVSRDVSWFELGCSAGAHMRILGDLGFTSPTGADISFGSLRKCEKGHVLQADALRLPFADRSVDGLTTSGTLMHLGPPERLSLTFMEILRVTRRYLFFMEIWAAQPTFYSFGNLLPPAWVYPWDEALLPFIGDEWDVTYSKRYELLPTARGLVAPICVLLIERK